MKQTLTNSEIGLSRTLDAADETPRSAQPSQFSAGPWKTLNRIWGQRRFVARSLLAGVIFSAIVAFLIPKEYESTTQLMPPDTPSMSGLGMLASMTARTGGALGGVAGDVLGIKTNGALFVGVLQSHTVRERLVRRFNLQEVYRARFLQDAEKKLAEQTVVSEDRKSGIITIKARDRSPQRAAAIAAGYVEELDRLVTELSTSAAHRERVFLEDRLKTVKKDLDAASERFGQFASKNTAIDIQSQGRAMVDAAARLQGELIAAQSESEMLKQIYTENNVRVRAARARIIELERQLEKMGGAPAQASTNGGQAADPLYPSIRELPLLGIAYADLSRRAKIEEAVYEILTQQYELAKVQEAKETPSVKVLDSATVPEKKSYPPRLLIMVLGTALTLGLALAWVLGQARWDETDPGDPGKVLAQEVFQAARSQMAWDSTNGSPVKGAISRAWGLIHRQGRNGEAKESNGPENKRT